MKKYIIHGGKPLSGEVVVSGAKNVVVKALVASCLTTDEITLENIPLINDLFVMLELIRQIGGKVALSGHTVKIKVEHIKSSALPLEIGAKVKTSSMFLAPLLIRCKSATIPNPGGCRIGARPIDRHIDGLEKMGAQISYYSEDGYFHAKTAGLKGTEYTFEKSTHTGTETLILAAVLAEGTTTLKNAAQEPEIDELISLLNKMGAKVARVKPREIIIEGVESLHGTTYNVMPDRNESVTFAVASAITGGNIWIKNMDIAHIKSFLDAFSKAGGKWEEKNMGIRFYIDGQIKPVDITTCPHPGFMTDWQGPWSVLATQANGVSTIHETIYENRFAYVSELSKMGAKMKLYNPHLANPEEIYNFNYDVSKKDEYRQALRITGKTNLHNAVLNIYDLRAGATVVLATLIAKGTSVIYGIEFLERGYESFDARLRKLGADLTETEEGEMRSAI